MPPFSRLVHLAIISALYLTLPESSSQKVQHGQQTAERSLTPQQLNRNSNAEGRSILSDLGSTLGSLLGGGYQRGASTQPEVPKAKKTGSAKKEESDGEDSPSSGKHGKSNKKSDPDEEHGPPDDDVAESKPKKTKKKIIRKIKKKTTPEPTKKNKKLRPKYVDDEEELTDTDKDWLSGLMDKAKVEQLRFEKELVEEILQHAKEDETTSAASTKSVAKKVQGYLVKLRDTAREKGEDLYDKTKQLFADLIGKAKEEGPTVLNKVKTYVSKVLVADGGDSGAKGPLSGEDKEFLASLMAGVKWGDEESNTTIKPDGTNVSISSTTALPSATTLKTSTGETYQTTPPATQVQTTAAPKLTTAPTTITNTTAAPATVASATKAPAIVAPTTAATTASSSPAAASGSFEQQALDAHNQLRAKHGSPPLTLNPELTKTAQAWANNIAGRGKMQHSVTEYGENIYYSFSELTSAREPVDKWYAEISAFDWNCLDCSFEKTGHFTQVIWAESKELGIAKASGQKGTYVVANYNPAGNFEGSYANNTLPIK